MKRSPKPSAGAEIALSTTAPSPEERELAWAMGSCELCAPADVIFESTLAYARYDSNSLSRGHVLVIPRRHVADFFDMAVEEQGAVLDLLNKARVFIKEKYSPDGFNIGVNVGKAAGQNRMHVHVHLIPRYTGDVPDPSGGIRCVLKKK